MPSFEIVIVGAGIAGIAASIGLSLKGHKVTVIESMPGLRVFGDGIGIAANSQRILKYYDLLEQLQTLAKNDIGCMQHRRYETGEIISRRDMTSHAEQFGYPSYFISRKAYQQLLFDKAEQLGVQFQFDARADSVEDDSERPVLLLKDGRKMEADLIVAADGVGSIIRKFMYPDINVETPSECFRASIPASKLLSHELTPGLSSRSIDFWMGPHRIFVTSPCSDIDQIGISLIQPGNTGDLGSWKKKADLEQMREVGKDFAPSVRKVLEYVDEAVVWKLSEVPSLPSWVSKGGRVLLIGDAAHGMQPHQGQGGAQGLEDGASLAEALTLASASSDITQTLHAFEKLRKPRVEVIVKAASGMSTAWMLPDGKGQQQRDAAMRKIPMWASKDLKREHIDKIPESLRDPTYPEWVMGHDAVEFARRQLGQLLA